jgi:hypothetical protein
MCRKLDHETKQGVDTGERKLVIRERDGTLKNLLKKSYLKRWIGPLDVSGKEVESSPNNEGNFFNQRSNSVDFARHVLIFGVGSDFIISMDDFGWIV